MIPIIFSSIFLSAMEPPSYYVYKKGEGEEKSDFENHSLLTLNVDMLKGRLPSLYGGITAPTPERAKRLGEYVARENPDIFLSQEIPLESASFVYEALKGQFPHIWMGMGLQPGEQESGLFVASKYPITSEPKFIPFPNDIQDSYVYPDEIHDLYPVRILDRGFFAVETQDFWVVDTHLEPGSPEKGGPYRKAQLAYLTEQMDQIAKDKPYILVGDLNIRRTGEKNDDYTNSGLAHLYYDFYTLHHPEFGEATYTCTNLLEARANGVAEPTDPKERNEIDDYVLIRDGFQTRFKEFDVQLLRDTYDLSQDPSKALTDHRAYKAIFKI